MNLTRAKSISGRAFFYWLRRLGLSRSTSRQLIRIALILARPYGQWKRVSAARKIAKSGERDLLLTREKAFAKFDKNTVPEITPALETLRRLYVERADEKRARMQEDGEVAFLTDLLRPSDFIDYPEILDLVLSNALLNAASVYLGEVPLLTSVRLWWSPPNETAKSSQLYHLDQIDSEQAKVFVNIEEVDSECGPFTFLPADVSARAAKDLGYDGDRVSDEDMYRVIEQKEAIQLTGLAGEGAILDSSRCFHYGSRGNAKDRIVLMFQYARFNHAAEQKAFLPRDISRVTDKKNSLREMALDLRDSYYVDLNNWNPPTKKGQ